MIVRLLNLLVIGALIFAAAYVYRIKFNSTVQAERLAKLSTEVRRERDAIAALRARWGELDNPARIQAFAKRYLQQLKPEAPTQFDMLDRLPERPPQEMQTGNDPIGGIIENLEVPVPDRTASATGVPSSGAPGGAPAGSISTGIILPDGMTTGSLPSAGVLMPGAPGP
jgi:hypothetical protein